LSTRIRSLSVRLAAAFAVVTAVTLGVVGASLYVTLASLVRTQDDEALVTIMEAARLRLRNYVSVADLRAHPVALENLAAQRHNLVLILRTASGETLLDSHRGHPPLPQLTPVVDGIPITVEAFSDWPLGGGTPSRAGAAWGHAGSGETVEIVAALSAGDRAALLVKYRAGIVQGMLAGAAAAALLGLLLIRAGLYPLRRIAAEAAAITVNRLQTRLDAQSAPRELQELVSALNRMLDRIEDGFQRLSQFAADVAHDLRTPLSNLMGQSQVALNKPRTAEEYQSLLASNIEEFERLARMLENMLFLARADNAQVALRRETFDVRAELERFAEYFHGMADERGVSIRAAAGPGAGLELSSDPILFRRAVHNLLVNAIRYTPRGCAIELSAEQAGGDVAVAVRNPGPGIAAEDLPHIFDRFYRGDKARTDSATSAGLGLAIVQSIARLHGGRVEVDSRDGVTEFRLVLPATPRN
jgi:two-component system, OmpR family, heavy metal sensor histidine kinase CusS